MGWGSDLIPLHCVPHGNLPVSIPRKKNCDAFLKTKPEVSWFHGFIAYICSWLIWAARCQQGSWFHGFVVYLSMHSLDREMSTGSLVSWFHSFMQSISGCGEYSDIQIYLNIFRYEYLFVLYSYHFFDTNIFGYFFVLFFSIRIYSNIRSYQNFIFVTLCSSYYQYLLVIIIIF